MDQPETPTPKSVEISSPADLARLVAGWVLIEAVNIGEINPAMARRFSERMDQIFTAATRGAQIGWDNRGALQIKWPPSENSILAAVAEKGRQRDLAAETALSKDFEANG